MTVDRSNIRPRVQVTAPIAQGPTSAAPTQGKGDIASRGYASSDVVSRVARPNAVTAAEPNPSRHDHAVYSVTFDSVYLEPGAETALMLLAMADEYIRAFAPFVGEGKWEQWNQDVGPYVAPHSRLQLEKGLLGLQFDVWSVMELGSIGGFTTEAKLDDLRKQGKTSFELSADSGRVKVRGTIGRRTIRRSDVTPAFIKKRDGDWARIAADYSVQVTLVQTAKAVTAGIAEVKVYREPEGSKAEKRIEEIRDSLLAARAAVTAVDVDMPERPALVAAYNQRVREHEGRTTVEVLDRQGKLKDTVVVVPSAKPYLVT